VRLVAAKWGFCKGLLQNAQVEARLGAVVQSLLVLLEIRLDLLLSLLAAFYESLEPFAAGNPVGGPAVKLLGHPSLISSRALLEEALPADYAVVSITSAKSRPWSYLAANYAAALGSPILLIPQNAPPGPAEELPAALLRGTDLRSLSDRDL
jgi:hypothetical protein